jgi:hypothetical protein
MNAIKNRFFESNFLTFVKEHEEFFKKYRLKFCVNFLEILKKKNPSLKITQEYKRFAQETFDSLFVNGDFEKIVIKDYPVLESIKQNGVDLEEILDKTFLLLVNAFTKYAVKQKNSVSVLKKLLSLCEFYKEYLTLHTKNDFETTSKIPKEIKSYYLNNKPLAVFSVYKGIPISHKTFINSLNESKGTVEVEASYYHIIASKFKKEIYLLEPQTNTTFKAFISQIYPKRKILELHSIEKINRKSPKRNYIRVQPKEEIIVTLTKNEKAHKTKMFDLSLKGCAVISENKIPLEIGDILTIQFLLENPQITFVTLHGELKSITKLNNGTYKYHFYFEPNPKEEKILEKYITQREKEIIRELQIFLKKVIRTF